MKSNIYGTWCHFILPHLEQGNVYNAFNFMGIPGTKADSYLNYEGATNRTHANGRDR